ncbi:restriction endonuclease subunit S [Cellulomonas uda]|uniref:Type I restriction modification DNA specificity domain-containing protein n=1 Tax=Cellulomonas uda TaxID=1714 RepID=A0A4Y3K7D4_CELUD|nr:restriction endonuclease subunit S [Cellulomonas uda]NII65987.1 type I restriction enzyme S subunit [Cellulomonas uda]GEA80451.1 hypothetical protein CUD01_08950 [Cellulomonas uda]
MNDVTLGDGLEVLIDYRGKTPAKLGSAFTDSGVPVASALLVKAGRLDLGEARFVDAETAARWMSIPTARGDVLLTSEAPLGRVARVPSDDPVVLGQRIFGLRGKRGVLDTGYLYYALQSDPVQASLRGHATGTTVLGIRQAALRTVRIPAPGWDEQRAIAEVLGALDDKIAANDRVVRNIESLADAIFRRAQSAAVEPGVTTFGEIAEVSGGGTPSTRVPEYWDGGVRWATPTDVTRLSAPYLSETSRTITDAGLGACSSSTYPPGSILMTSRATIGAFALAQVPVAVNQGFIVVNARKARHQLWLFHDMRSRVPEFLTHANGATFLELSRGRFKSINVAVPDDDRIDAFNETVRPLHDLAAQTVLESAAVATTRDELLPLLMSGKVQVRDAEKRVEEVL